MFLTNHAHNAVAFPSLPFLHREVIDLLFKTLCRIMLQHYTKSLFVCDEVVCEVVLMWFYWLLFLEVYNIEEAVG